MRFFPSPRRRPAPSLAVVACVFGQTSRRLLSKQIAGRLLRVIESISYLRRRICGVAGHRPESNLGNLEGATAWSPCGVPHGTTYYGNKYREELVARRDACKLRQRGYPPDRGRFTRHPCFQFILLLRRSSTEYGKQ